MQPASISSVKSLPRMHLLNSLSVLADLSSEDSSDDHDWSSVLPGRFLIVLMEAKCNQGYNSSTISPMIL